MRWRWMLCLLTMLGILGCQKSDPLAKIEQQVGQGRPMMKVGDKVIYEGQFQMLRDVIPGFTTTFATPEGRRQILDQIIEQEAFVQKSREAKLIETSTDLQRKLWLNQRSLEGGEYVSQVLDKRAYKQYQKDKDQYYSEVEVADIVYQYQKTDSVDPQEQQELAMAKAQKTFRELTPENFAEIASKESDDPIGKGNGGKIGVVSFIDQRVGAWGWKPLVEKAFAMKAGEISEPIATRDGVHLIKVLSEKKVQPFSEVKYFIRRELEASVKKELLDEILKTKKVEYLLPGLEPPPAATESAPSSS